MDLDKLHGEERMMWPLNEINNINKKVKFEIEDIDQYGSNSYNRFKIDKFECQWERAEELKFIPSEKKLLFLIESFA